jgi:hypothetical protein
VRPRLARNLDLAARPYGLVVVEILHMNIWTELKLSEFAKNLLQSIPSRQELHIFSDDYLFALSSAGL